jgi:hypothetical protein
MCTARHPAPEPRGAAEAASAAQVDACSETCSEPDIAGYHECKVALAAERGKRTPEHRAMWLAIVAEDDAAEPRRQVSDRRSRIGEATRICEQPEHRDRPLAPLALAGLDPSCPGDELCVHVRIRSSCCRR